MKVNARVEDQSRYRNRKGDVTINVIGLCNPKVEWIYCLAGWEGSAHDSRILKDALSRPNGLKLPKGNSKMIPLLIKTDIYECDDI
ncbi:hypothetical protein LINGRAHAP2_LOCUS20519 [Linum grandiflorum]